MDKRGDYAWVQYDAVPAGWVRKAVFGPSHSTLAENSSGHRAGAETLDIFNIRYPLRLRLHTVAQLAALCGSPSGMPTRKAMSAPRGVAVYEEWICEVRTGAHTQHEHLHLPLGRQAMFASRAYTRINMALTAGP